MGIKNTLTGVVTRRHTETMTMTETSRPDELDLLLAPYTVTETSIRIPRQREGGSRAG